MANPLIPVYHTPTYRIRYSQERLIELIQSKLSTLPPELLNDVANCLERGEFEYDPERNEYVEGPFNDSNYINFSKINVGDEVTVLKTYNNDYLDDFSGRVVGYKKPGETAGIQRNLNESLVVVVDQDNNAFDCDAIDLK
jgi:hypothetical protein